MAEREDRMECDLEEGELPDHEREQTDVHIYFLLNKNVAMFVMPYITVCCFFIPTVDQHRNTKIVDLRTAITPRKGNIQTVVFDETGANTTKYYDRDARPSLHESENTSRPIIQYDDDCYVEVDVWEPDEKITDDKENQIKASKGEDDGISVEINVKGKSKESRKVKVEKPGTKKPDKLRNRSNSFSSMLKNAISPKNNSRTKKRHHSPDTRQKQELHHKRSKHKSWTRHNGYKGRTSSRKGHTQLTTSDRRIVQKKNTNDRIEGTSGRRTTHHSFSEHSNRCDKRASPVLLENGKRVSPKRGSRSPSAQETVLHSYSPISERSFSPPPRQNQEKRFTAEAFNTTDKVPIYIMLVRHLSHSCKQYLTPHEIHAILNSDPILSHEQEKSLMNLIRQNDNLFVSKFMGTSFGIWPKTDVKICSVFTNNPQKDHQCNDLHICKYDMLSMCNAKYCRFGHELFNNHNLKVLKLFSLDGFDKDQIRRLMQTKESRNISTLPLICKFYNNKGGCDRANCKHLHVCSHFITGKCKFHFQCKRSHTICVGQPFEILKEHGLPPSYREEPTINKLISQTLENGNVKLKREITTGVELPTMEETKKSTKTCTTNAWFRNNNTEGRPMPKKTTMVNFQNVKSQDFISIADPDDSSGSEAMLADSKDNTHRIDKIEKENTDDEYKEETTETGVNSKLSNTVFQKGNSTAETRISECRNKNVSKSLAWSISPSNNLYELERDDAFVASKDGSPCSIHIECGEEEFQSDEVGLANRNSETNQNNIDVQHREYGLTEAILRATTLETSTYSNEPVSTIHSNAGKLTSSNAHILPAWTSLQPTSPEGVDNDTDVHFRDKCDHSAPSDGICGKEGYEQANTCIEQTSRDKDEDLESTKTAIGNSTLQGEHIDESTSLDTDICNKREITLSSIQSVNKLQNQLMGKYENECDANSGNGDDNECDANSGKGCDNECDASSGKGCDNECDAKSGKCGYNKCDANSGNGGDNECGANIGKGGDNECDVNSGNGDDNVCGANIEKVDDNECDANIGRGGDNECGANSWKGGDNECDANSGNDGVNECYSNSGNGGDNERDANSGNDSDNECNANTGNGNSENGCITECDYRNSSNANADDWPIFEELSMEYKRNSSTRKIRFRHNSGNWQIATSSGMWKELDSADESIINNVANVCEKYALDN